MIASRQNGKNTNPNTMKSWRPRKPQPRPRNKRRQTGSRMKLPSGTISTIRAAGGAWAPAANERTTRPTRSHTYSASASGSMSISAAVVAPGATAGLLQFTDSTTLTIQQHVESVRRVVDQLGLDDLAVVATKFPLFPPEGPK